MNDLRLIDNRESPEELIRRSRERHDPIRTFCLFSGGSDSLVVAHRCRDHYDELIHIDTGTAAPGVQDHVKRCAEDLGKPLQIRESFTEEEKAAYREEHGRELNAYRLLVLGGVDWKGDEWEVDGFPGPSQHPRAYNRLKTRALDLLLRETKEGHPRTARVMALAGIRRDESKRRQNRPAENMRGSLVFCNPLVEWTNREMANYRAENDLRLSDVAALLHRSGECNCGCFADEGEREMLKSLWPEWFEETIGCLEREAEEMGLACPLWGGNREQPAVRGGELCSSCDAMLAAGQTTLPGV